MGISGSDPALMFAQSGVIRSGASRSGYYTPFTVAITVKGVDWTERISKHSIRVEQQVGGAVASFTVVKDSAGTYPEFGEVVITQGSSANRLFAGYIMRPTLWQRRASSRARIAFECVDYSWLLDRYVVTGKYYANRNAMTILGDLLYQLPSGHRKFTPDSDGCTFPNIDFQANHVETIASAISRLANRVGAQWYVDAYKVVHLFEPGGQTGVGSATELSDSATHFWGLEVLQEPSQARTRVYSLGGRAGVTAATAAGSTTLPLDDTSEFGASGGELLCGANYLTYTGKTSSTLTGIPASGAGAILYPIAEGEEARILATRNDTSAQTALAADLGSGYLSATDDGVVSHAIEDGSATDAQARLNGDGELALYSGIPQTLRYRTRDQRTQIGRLISTGSLTLPWTIASSFTIRSVTITGFGHTTKRPMKETEAGGFFVDLGSVLPRQTGQW